MEKIISKDNSKLKLCQKLLTNKGRKEHGLFIAEGVRLLSQGGVADFYLLDEAKAASLTIPEGLCYLVPPELFAKITTTEHSQGIIGVYKIPKYNLEDLQGNFFLVLDKIQDPGNAGTLIRTAEAAGASAVIATKGTVDLYSPKVVRSTMGSVFNLLLYQNISYREIAKLSQAKMLPLVVTALDSKAKNYYEVDYSKGCILVMGNEGWGVSAEIMAIATEKVYIAMQGKIESLNVATSGAVVLFEINRQIYSKA